MVKKIIFLISLIIFCALFTQVHSGVLNLPQPHGYGVPKAMDAWNKADERRRQEKREQELYQRQLEYQQKRERELHKRQMELEEQRSRQKRESLMLDIILSKASKGKMTENDKMYLEKYMGSEEANIIWEFNESNK